MIKYLIIINLVAFATYYVDKRKAVKQRYRISEQALLLLALAGGAFGSLAAMQVFRHKTKKPKFFVTVPVLCIVWMIIIFFVVIR